MDQKQAKELLAFIENSPSSFHVIENMKQDLEAAGFQGLKEQDSWQLEAGKGYYVSRNDSALIAFRVPQSGSCSGFQIIASHSDSPMFKVKENPEIRTEGCYTRLNVEKYGGMIDATWLDRPLSAAGRVLVRVKGADGSARLESRLVNLDRDLVLIPNLAIHMNPEINKGHKMDPKTDLVPLFAGNTEASLNGLLAAELGVEAAAIEATDVFLYNRQKGTIWGAEGEFLSIGRLDDLECVYGSLRGILEADGSCEKVAVCCVMDNEEVGSETKQGAAGTFLRDTLVRVNRCLGGNEETYLRAVAGSFLISADNAHAVHPNRSEAADSGNRPHMNEGIVIKYSGSQKYASDAVSGALLKLLAEKADVPTQIFTNRSDMAGGSTLGNISTSQVSVRSVDIGLPQLAMHSSYETAGIKDISYLIDLAKTFYSSTLIIGGDGSCGWK